MSRVTEYERIVAAIAKAEAWPVTDGLGPHWSLKSLALVKALRAEDHRHSLYTGGDDCETCGALLDWTAEVERA